MNVLLLVVLACSLFVSDAVADERAESLDLLVFGASGRVGGHVVKEALDRGHRVTGVSRNPSGLTNAHANFRAAEGDILDAGSVASLVEGYDVVVVSVRGVAPGAEKPEDSLVYRGVENVIEALRRTGSEARLVHVGGAGSLEIAPGVLLAERLPRFLLPRDFELELDGQVMALEYLRGVPDIDWTVISPPRNLTGGKRREEYRTGMDRLLEDDQGRSRISRADFAAALVDEIEKPRHLKERFTVAW